MTRFAASRLTTALWRMLLATALILGAVEIAILSAGSQGEAASRHVFGEALAWITGEVPGTGTAGGMAWWAVTARGGLESLKVLAWALLLVIGIGPPLGILAARFRRMPLIEVLWSPLFLAAFWPGVWAACLAIWGMVEKWGRPGFADAGSGDRLWWHAFLIAAIVAPPAIAWQIRSIAWAIRDAARADHVRGALGRGQSGSRLFYRHVFASSLEPVLRCLDRVLPAMIGGQLLVEWTFRYPGLGTLMIDTARDGHFSGLLAGGTAMSLLIVASRFGGELIYGAADRRGRERMAAASAS